MRGGYKKHTPAKDNLTKVRMKGLKEIGDKKVT